MKWIQKLISKKNINSFEKFKLVIRDKLQGKKLLWGIVNTESVNSDKISKKYPLATELTAGYSKNVWMINPRREKNN